MCGSVIASGGVSANVVQVLNGIVGMQFLGSEHHSSSNSASTHDSARTCSLWECLCIAKGLTAYSKIELKYLQAFTGIIVLAFLYAVACVLRRRCGAASALGGGNSSPEIVVSTDDDGGDVDAHNRECFRTTGSSASAGNGTHLSDALLQVGPQGSADLTEDLLNGQQKLTSKVSCCTYVARVFSGAPDQFAGALAQWMLLAYTSVMSTTAAMITCSNSTPAFLFYDGSWECGIWQVGAGAVTAGDGCGRGGRGGREAVRYV